MLIAYQYYVWKNKLSIYMCVLVDFMKIRGIFPVAIFSLMSYMHILTKLAISFDI